MNQEARSQSGGSDALSSLQIIVALRGVPPVADQGFWGKNYLKLSWIVLCTSYELKGMSSTVAIEVNKTRVENYFAA